MKTKAKDKDADKGVDFPIPAGYKPPVSSRIGEEFTVLATFRIDKDEPDEICLTKIENVPVSAEADDENDDEPATSPELMSAIQQSSAGAPAASI